jgi:two-component system response regulator CssR
MVDHAKNLKILIVDDDENVLDMLEAILMRMGFHKILKSRSCEEAGRLTKEDPPDLFFIDIMLPGMPGDEFRGLLKENSATQDTPVIFISGIISKEEEKDIGGRLAGGDVILAKPFSIERIAEAITESLKKKKRSGLQ